MNPTLVAPNSACAPPTPPTATTDTNGNVGDFSWDGNYFYSKTPAGWKRSALTTF